MFDFCPFPIKVYSSPGAQKYGNIFRLERTDFVAHRAETHTVSLKSAAALRRATGSYRGTIHTLRLPADELVSREGQVAPGY